VHDYLTEFANPTEAHFEKELAVADLDFVWKVLNYLLPSLSQMSPAPFRLP
jgi:hypothetical protein